MNAAALRLDGPLHLDAGIRSVRVEALTLAPGDLAFLTGPTGAGKTLLARALAQPQTWSGRPRIGLVQQEPSSYIDPYTPTARQLHQVGVASSALPRFLRRLGLPADRAKASPAGLSVGQQQRLLIGLEAARRLDLLIADEPTSALDPLNRAACLDLLVDSLHRGSPRRLLIVTHDPLVVELARAAWRTHGPDRPFPSAHYRLAPSADDAAAFELRPDDEPFAEKPHIPRLWWPCQRILQHFSQDDENAADPATALDAELGRKGLASLRELQQDLPSHVPTGPVHRLDQAYFYGPPYAAPGIDLERRPIDLQRGRIDALVGASGAGKTTLLRLAAGLLRRPWTRRPKPTLRLVFQNPDSTTLNPSQSIRRLIASLPLTPGTPDRLLPLLLDRLDLPAALLDRDPPTLSGGEKYRCGLLLALLAEPDFLLLDEPFAAVDLDTQERLADVFIALKRGTLPPYRQGRPCGLLLVTHQLEIAFQLADRWHLLDHPYGRPYSECVWQGTPLEAWRDFHQDRIDAPYLRRLLDHCFNAA